MSSSNESVPTPAVERPNPTVDELEADRAATRARLAASVEALAAKADVKGRAKQQAEETTDQIKARARDLVSRARQLPPAALAGIAAGVGLIAILAIRGGRRA
ncbi:MAG TPA: DUF3618 domain-containing protein [Microlunatus sp.]